MNRACILRILLLLSLIGVPALGDLRSDLVAHWAFNDGAGSTATDSSGNGHHGALNLSPQWVEGLYGGAIEFTHAHTEECVVVPAFEVTSGGITLAAWVKPKSFAQADARIIDKGVDVASADDAWWMLSPVSSAGQIRLRFRLKTDVSGTTTTQIATAGGLVVGEWSHTAAVWDGASMILYGDGVEVGRVAKGGTAVAANPNARIYIGNQLAGTQRRPFDGAIDDACVFNRGLTAEEIGQLMAGLSHELASDPDPADQAHDVPRDVVLSWKAGELAAAHDVYFGASFADVTDATRADPVGVLVSQGQTATTYDPPGLLDFGQTYYWRIDEVNAAPDSTIFKGDVWSFTTEPFAYPVEDVVATSNGISQAGAGPQNTVDGSGLDAEDRHSIGAEDMWLADPPADEALYIEYAFDRVYKLHEMLVWNYNVQFELVLGFGLKDVTIEYSVDGAEWMVLGDAQFARGTARADYVANTVVDLQGVAAQFVRLTVNSGWGPMGQYGLSEVRFLYIPAQAREPQPADGATNVDPETALSWRAGRDAASHNVYLGTDADEIPLIASVVGAPHVSGELTFGTTYYWQVDAVSDEVWAGELWSFATLEYRWIDGFETYTDDIDAGEAIFDTWIDGWVNNTGSTVGHLQTPFAERAVVRSGRQSMPLYYDNASSPFYSEAERTFANANWSGNGADTLVLYVRGNAPAFLESADGQILMSATGTDIWDSADQFRYAYKSLSGNGSIIVRVDSLVRSDGWAKAGVMIRETLEPGSKHAFVAVTPDNGVSFQRRPVAGTTSYNTDAAGIVAPHWVKLTRTGNVFTAQQSADGVTWVDITPTAPVEITMAANVFIGLALTSHNASVSTAAEFSNLTTTGNVTGAWQTAGIGATQPEGNSAQPMYVRIEDSTGTAATVVSVDATITLRPTWQEWKVPYADLAGVNLSRVQKTAIGVGSRTSPRAGGTGIVYVDDIGFGKPAAE